MNVSLTIRPHGPRGRLAMPLLAALLAAAAPAEAKVGVAAAVAPSAWGAPPAGVDRPLATGAELAAGERLRTDSRGSIQVLFQDGSSMALGPDAELTLDEYAYRPEERRGSLGVSLGRGLMRFVGGAISKEDAVSVRTPAATIGIRGGIAIIESGPVTAATLLYGLELTIEAGGRTVRLERPGFRVAVGADGAPGAPEPLGPEALAALLGALEPPRPPGGQQQAAIGDDDVAGAQMALLNDLGALGDLETAAGEVSTSAAGSPEGAFAGELAEASGANRIEQAARQAEPQDRPGDLGPEPPANAEPPAPPVGPTAPSGPMTGRIKLAADPAAGVDDADPAANLGLQGGGFTAGAFEAVASNGRLLRLAPDSSARFVSEAQPFGAAILTGEAAIAAADFVVFELADGAGGRVFAFAGEPTGAAALPQAGAQRYALGADFLRGQNLPFLDDILDGATGEPSAPGWLGVAWHDEAAGAQRAVAGGAVAIFGQGAAQRRASSILVGRIGDDPEGRPHLQARLLGSRRVAPDGPATLYRGGVASSDGAGGADFFGAGASFVLEAALVDDADSPLGRGVARSEGGAIFPNHVASGATELAGARTSRTLGGFAGGLERAFAGSAGAEIRTIGTAGDPGVSLATDAGRNTLAGSFALRNSDGQLVRVEFGSTAPSGMGAFVNDATFAALSVATEVAGAAVDGAFALISASALQQRDFLPAGVQFCDCRFVAWGFWGGEHEAAPGAAERRQVELASWVAGPLAEATQIVGLPAQFATFNGHAIGEVAAGGAVYQAVGRASLTFNFAPGGFRFTKATIADFDGMTLTGANASPALSAANAYSNAGVFDIAGVHPAHGPVSTRLSGAFFGEGAPPRETAGDFAMSGGGYSAAGTFAAAR